MMRSWNILRTWGDGMSSTIDSISIRGLRKTHLHQLAEYIRDRDGSYWGNRSQFERRHADLLKLADQIEAIANDAETKIAGVTG
jgi:hypothetical protein